MATNFPTSLDTFTNPATSSDTSVVSHAGQHDNINDSVAAVEAKVGINSSAVATSLDYKLTNSASSDPGHKHTLTAGVSGTLPVANGGTGVTASTGTGSVVLSNTPSLTTPSLGAATMTSINKVAFTAPTTAATFAFGTDNTTQTFQGTDTIVGRATTDTLTNKSISGATNTITALPTTAYSDASVTSRKMKPDKLTAVTDTTFSTASATYVDITGLTTTFTPDVASNLLILIDITSRNNSAGQGSIFRVLLDGSAVGNDPTFELDEPSSAGSQWKTGTAHIWATGVSVAAHTVKAQVKTTSGTVTLLNSNLIVIPFAS